jgi:hypothetical protein
MTTVVFSVIIALMQVPFSSFALDIVHHDLISTLFPSSDAYYVGAWEQGTDEIVMDNV